MQKLFPLAFDLGTNTYVLCGHWSGIVVVGTFVTMLRLEHRFSISHRPNMKLQALRGLRLRKLSYNLENRRLSMT